MSVKIKRIESELVKTISETLLLESNDEFLKTVTITAAEVASDLSYAKVYFTSFPMMIITDTPPPSVNSFKKKLALRLIFIFLVNFSNNMFYFISV